MVDNSSKLKTEIERLKREKNAVILAHYYTLPEVQEVADFLGDSLALSIEAQKTDARIILFAGVHFMAETAKVLSPEKKVLLPNLEAGCSLAESCDAAAFAAFKAKYPGYKVVSYVNTSVGVKALTDVCCTSSNALKVVESIPADQPIIFAPDRNLGSYIQKLTGRENMVIWDGACHVHEEFSLEKILELKRQHPAAQVVVHPECRAYIVQVADFVGSTAAILDYCGKSSAREFIVVTEAGILTEMKRRYPEKTFIPAPPDDEACGCNNCRYMKMITLENIFTTLRDERPEISLDEEVRRRAERSILNMIAIKRFFARRRAILRSHGLCGYGGGTADFRSAAKEEKRGRTCPAGCGEGRKKRTGEGTERVRHSDPVGRMRSRSYEVRTEKFNYIFFIKPSKQTF